MAIRKSRSSKSRRSTRRATTRRSTPRRASTRRVSTRRPSTRRAGKVQRPWSREEIAFMRKYYRNHETAWIARQLGRTVYSVRYKAVDLSIKKSRPSIWRGNKGAANAFRKVAGSRGSKTRRSTSRSRSTSRRKYSASSKKRNSRKASPRRSSSSRRRTTRRRTR